MSNSIRSKVTMAAVGLMIVCLDQQALAGPVSTADDLVPFAAAARYTYGASSDQAFSEQRTLADGSKLIANWIEIIDKSNLSYIEKKSVEVAGIVSGFNANLFQAPDGKMTLAFEGTGGATAGGDLLTDAFVAIDAKLNKLGVPSLGGVTEPVQSVVAQIIALNVDAEYPGKSVTNVGHSLGGSLAMSASTATGHPAVIFNPAGVPIASDQQRKSLSTLVTVALTKGSIVDDYIIKPVTGSRVFGNRVYLDGFGHGMDDILKILGADSYGNRIPQSSDLNMLNISSICGNSQGLSLSASSPLCSFSENDRQKFGSYPTTAHKLHAN